uniref:Uncharacterized protein n=1 Tax=Anguilla anguilla TaxID=7936 RepID=A0A0E9W501_ANGAN
MFKKTKTLTESMHFYKFDAWITPNHSLTLRQNIFAIQ